MERFQYSTPPGVPPADRSIPGQELSETVRVRNESNGVGNVPALEDRDFVRDLWDIHFEKQPKPDGNGFQYANPKVVRAVCVYCKVRNVWPAGKDGWTCVGNKRDMVRHLTACEFFEDESAREKYGEMLVHINQRISHQRVSLNPNNSKRIEGRGGGGGGGGVEDDSSTRAARVQYENLTLKMLVQSNVPYQFLELSSTKEWIEFLAKNRSVEVSVPNQIRLTTTVLDRVADEIDDVMRKRSRTAKGDGRSVYLKNLPFSANEVDLVHALSEFGAVNKSSVQIRRKYADSEEASSAYGFLEFENASSWQQAIEASPLQIRTHSFIVEEKPETVNPRGVTLLFDCKVDVAREESVGFVAVTDKGEEFFITMADMNSSETNFLGSKIKEVVSRVESEYKVEVLAVTSNASEASRRGRQILSATRPDILSVDCAVDCISGLMADFFKSFPNSIEVVGEAIRILLYFTSHPLPAEKLKMKTLELLGKVVPLPLPHPSRWESVADALTALAEVGTSLHSLCVESGRRFIAAEPKKLREKNRAIVEKCKEDSFWRALEEILRVMVPLKVVRMAVESEDSDLGVVMKCLGQLRLQFMELENQSVGERMEKAVEKRWEMMDQQPHLLAYILNPNYRILHLNVESPIWQQTLVDVVRKAYGGCSRGSPTGEILAEVESEFIDYINRRGLWLDVQESLAIDKLNYWSNWDTSPPHIASLALRLLAIVPQASSVDRLLWPSPSLGGTFLAPSLNDCRDWDQKVKLAVVRANVVKGGDWTRESSSSTNRNGVPDWGREKVEMMRMQAKYLLDMMEEETSAGHGGEGGGESSGVLVSEIPLTHFDDSSQVISITEEGLNAVFEKWGWVESTSGDSCVDFLGCKSGDRSGWSEKRCALKDIFLERLQRLSLFDIPDFHHTYL